MRIAARVRTPRGGAVVRAVKPRGSGRVWPAPFTAAALGRGGPFLASCTIGLLIRGAAGIPRWPPRNRPAPGRSPRRRPRAWPRASRDDSIPTPPSLNRSAAIVCNPWNVPPRPNGSAYGSRIQPPSNPPSTPSLTPPTRSHSSPSSCTAGQASTRAPNSSAVRAPRARNRKLTRIRNSPRRFNSASSSYWSGAPAGVPDAGQAGRVEARVLGESGRRCASRRPAGRRIERHQVLGGVDQLAVQRPVVVAADPTWRATCYATSCSTSRRM